MDKNSANFNDYFDLDFLGSYKGSNHEKDYDEFDPTRPESAEVIKRKYEYLLQQTKNILYEISERDEKAEKSMVSDESGKPESNLLNLPYNKEYSKSYNKSLNKSMFKSDAVPSTYLKGFQ